MSVSDIVQLEIEGPVAIVTLNRPEALNALSRELSARLAEVFAALHSREDIKVAILTGAGRAFCAGMDLKQLSSGETRLQSADEVEGAGHRRFGIAPFDRPVIAAVNGFAITGGLELAMCCDIRIAAEGARFADTHARVGVIPGGRMSALLSRLVGIGRAKEMSLGGNAIDAATAERWGLVNRVVPPDDLMPICLKLAHDIATADIGYIRLYNRLIEENFETTYAEAVEHEHVTSRNANQTFERSRVDQDAIASRARSN
ncbi:enoyl-CoA hydratase [Sphingobium baderi]|uniref:enoyl-CoA hydratase n=1 Tax=Sphingobium baderi TaxID=1332080 RepID=UPI002B413E69|nr:enoyl-CoA hydratase [Sphingobium baderi]WRD77840.1 enoyl-CoA hydratase [Sphingobium baderi]